jgi:peptidoglycan hydrolase-like protein with peptidoglycan-binding domain
VAIPDIIIYEGNSPAKPAIPSPAATPVLRLGARTTEVRYVQRVLKERAGQTGLVIDGYFGPVTEGAVMSLQAFFGNNPTGVVDSTTWKILAYLGAAQPASPQDNITDRVTKVDVSLSMDRVSQITVTVADPGLQMFAANYFQIRRTVKYLGNEFEIASVEISQGPGGEQVVIECRNAACQRLKRDKGRKTFNVGSATAFAALMATEQSMSFFGEKSTSKGTISRVQSDTTDESSWDVLRRLAGENQFVLFETDNRLFFTSQQFLLGKFAVVATGTNPGFLATPIRWLTDPTEAITIVTSPAIPAPTGQPELYKGMPTNAHVKYVQTVMKQRAGQNIVIDGIFGSQTQGAVLNVQRFFKIPATGRVDFATWGVIKFLGGEQKTYKKEYSIKALDCPSVRKSDDDVYALTLSFQVTQEDGRQLRPGMTVTLADIPYFNGYFLINEVRWTEGTNSAVSVSARTPQEPSDRKKAEELRARIDYTGGGFAAIQPTDAFELI